jgi:predicted  nucleic acid-binding Zn-ribbon protein
MQQSTAMSLVFAALPCLFLPTVAVTADPIAKVMSLIDELTAKVTADGEAAGKAYQEYFEWCDDSSKNLGFELKDATSKKGKLTAQIEDLTSDIDASGTKIEELASTISSAEAELKAATEIRKKESADFVAGEKELVEAVDTLMRALSILEKEMEKNPASFAQIDTANLDSLVQSMNLVIDAAGFSARDKHKLVALLQAQQGSSDEDGDDDPGAPDAATYKSHSGGILDVLSDMKDKAESQLSDLRKAEATSAHEYDMLKQSLDDEISVRTKHMGEEKTSKAEAEQEKATATGDLARTEGELKADSADLATTQANCMLVAADHEATIAARKEELKVIAEAKKILQETTSGAVEQSYSLIQTSATSSLQLRQARVASGEVAQFVRKLAQRQHSAALAQLASRVAAVAKYGAGNGDDPFTKIKNLIQDMIIKLEKEAESSATEKAYCDEQMAKTELKKSELDDTIAKLTAKVDKAMARSAQLKEEVTTLQAELASLAKEQAESDKIRQESRDAYVKSKADLELGLGGIRQALQVLREYYGSSASASLLQDQDDSKFHAFLQQPAPPENHEKSGGAGGGIIGILEVCESDFAENLAKVESEEADEVEEYEKTTQENKVTKTTKVQDVKYKTQEFVGLDKTVSELTADRDTSSNELDAVMEYYSQIKDRCIAKPETYEDRAARRQAEIEGLKQALDILENEAAFVQQRRQRKRGHMRGHSSALSF